MGYQQIDFRLGRSIIVGRPRSPTFASAAVHLATLTLARRRTTPSPPVCLCVVSALLLRSRRVRLLPRSTRLACDPLPPVARFFLTPVAFRWRLGRGPADGQRLFCWPKSPRPQHARERRCAAFAATTGGPVEDGPFWRDRRGASGLYCHFSAARRTPTHACVLCVGGLARVVLCWLIV